MQSHKLLTVAVVETRDLHMIPGEMALSGVEGRFIHLLMNAMKIPYEVRVSPDGEWGQEMKNGSWTGIVGMVQRGEADIAVNQLSITKERLKAVNFSIPYSDELIQFVAPTPKRISSLIVYLYPFDIMIWLSCISILLLMPFMHVLLLPKGKKYSTELLRLLGCILKQPMYTKNKRMHRFYILLCLIFSMVISLSYCAVLLSFLSVPLYEPKIRTFSDLSKAVLGGQVKCQVIAGSFVLSLFLNSTDEQLRSVGELVERNSWTFQVKDYKNKTIDDRTASVSSALSLQSLYRDYKNIVFSEDSLMTTNLGIAMSKGFCCKEKLNDMISRIKNAGLYEKIKSEEYLTKPLALSVSHKLTGKRVAISVENIYGVLLLLVAGYILAFAVLIGEILFPRFYGNLLNSKPPNNTFSKINAWEDNRKIK